MGLHERKLNRLKYFNYSSNGWYFVTICIKNRIENFGNVIGRKMILNQFGKIANKFWLEIPNHFRNAELDEFIVMPNHLHGIIVIKNVGNADLRSLQNIKSNDKTKMMLSKIIHGYKSSVSREIRKLNHIFRWQKSFYDHIIRSEESLFVIRKYIRGNSNNWNNDKNNVENLYI